MIEAALRGICRTKRDAAVVTESIQLLLDRVTRQARGVIFKYITYGPVGLLVHSEASHVDELLFLERHRAHIVALSSQPLLIMGMLRADIQALIPVLQRVNPRLWQQSLLHEPVGSHNRRRYQKQLHPAFHSQIVRALAEERQCTLADAERLFAILVTEGVEGLIDWRCQLDPATAHARFAAQRINHAMNQHLSALMPSAQQEISVLLMHLSAAIREVGLPFPLLRLLHEHPSSIYRIHVGRRLWFGAPARQQQRLRRPHRIREHSRIALPKEHTDQLIARFVQLVAHPELNEAAARSRLRNFVTYGGIGLLSTSVWETCIDARLWNYLALMKVGHLEGTINWDRLLPQLNRYAAALNVPPFSRQLAQALLNAVRKPHRWHSGTSEMVLPVRLRATLVLRGQPRLHDVWSVFQLYLPYSVVDPGGSHLSENCFVLVVVDQASALPLGCWVSAQVPTTREAGLALYEAIWHPGMLDLPFRGIPETIRLSHLIAGPLTDLNHAAQWLLSKVTQFEQKPRSRPQVLDRLAQHAADVLMGQLGKHAATCEEVQRTLFHWMRTTAYATHRAAPVPPHWAAYGVAMPGFDSPAAGWLLPASGTVQTLRNGVVDEAIVHTHPDFQSAPGAVLTKRAFPFFYPGMDRGIFVEDAQAHLHYLPRSNQQIDGYMSSHTSSTI